MLWRVGALGVAATVVFLAVRPAPASYGLKGPGIIRLTDREVAFTQIDLGKRGRTPGDVEITRRLLFNKGITPKPLGHAELVCTFTAGRMRNCTGTYALPAGRIMVSGAVLYGQFFQLAVVGGTGRYENVHGTLTVTSLGPSPRRDIVIFRLGV